MKKSEKKMKAVNNSSAAIVKGSKKLKKKVKRKDYRDMNIDEFLTEELKPNNEENGEEASDNESISDKLKINTGTKNQENENDSDSENEVNDFRSHKESLAKLKDTDPEFYKFLKENDKKLLEFNDLDSENEDDEKAHKPDGDLEVASDESDFEDDSKVADERVITLKMIKQWQKNIQTDKSFKTINCLAKAFHAALIRVADEKHDFGAYKVDGSAVFNAVVQICVLEFGPAIRRYLKLPPGSKYPPQKSKRFMKMKPMLRDYFTDLLKLLSGVSSINIQNVLLKHLHYMSPFLVPLVKIGVKILKKLIHIWGTAEDTVRVIAFMCILRITNNNHSCYLEMVLKKMYLTYVKNSKFMSKGTLPGVNFMRRSLIEMFALDTNVSYQHVFLYIRQLAIHLRTAVTLQKKENIYAVCNWQFMNSLHLWADFLTATCNKPLLQPLIYPLVQITLGLTKLFPIPQYFPLRYHCLQILIDLSRDTSIFVPILPFLLEILTDYDFNKKHKKLSMKPIEFRCVVKMSKIHLSENGFKDAIIEFVYGQILEYLANHSHSITFPDLIVHCSVQMKIFLKKCSISNYTKRMKQLLEKIEQNSQFIENERKKVSFNLSDFKLIEAWESKIKNKGTPLNAFYESWNKLRIVKKRKQETDNDKLADFGLPQLKKIKKSSEAKTNDGPIELFPSDDEEFQTELEKSEEKEKKPNKQGSKKDKKKKKSKVLRTVVNVQNDDDEKLSTKEDIVQDIKMSDW